MDLFTLVGKIAIDCTEAETKIDSLLAKAGQLNTALGGTSGSGGTGTTSTTTSTDTTDTSNSTTTQNVAVGTFMGNVLTKVVHVLGGWVVDSAKEGYGYELDKEKYIAELKTMMDSTWEEAESFFNELNALSISTPLNMSSIGTGASRFLSLGYEPDKIIEMMQVIGDLAKGDNASFVRILKAVSDVMGKSTLQAQEKNQFSEAGVPLYALLADYYGMPYATDADKESANALFMEQQKHGDIPATDVWNALVKSTQEGGRFHNAMDIAMETLAGQTEKGEELSAMVSGKFLKKTGLFNIPEWWVGRKNENLEELNEILDNPDSLKETPEMQKVMDIVDAITAPTPTYNDLVNPAEVYGPPTPEGWTPGNSISKLETVLTRMEEVLNPETFKAAAKEGSAEGIANGLSGVTITTGSVTLNDGVLVGRILPRINLGLGQIAAREMRG